MSLLCKIKGHNWDGCKCARCGETRDMMHVFELLKNRCVKRCARCGKEAEIPHTWEREGCELRCKVCGAAKTDHKWKSHKCAFCGTYDDELKELFDQKYVNVNDSAVVRVLNSLDQETLTELTLKAKCGYVNHAALKRVKDPVALSRIKDETGNAYIRRLVSEKFPCPNCGKELGINELKHCRCGSCGEEVHDYVDVEKAEHDGKLFESGVRFKRCRRCGHKTKPRDYMHYLD